MINLSTFTIALILSLSGARTFAQNNKLITDRLTSETQIAVDQQLVSANKNGTLTILVVTLAYAGNRLLSTTLSLA